MTEISNAIIVSPLDEKMEQELVKHNVTDAVIATLKSKYGDLKLRDLNDKENYLIIKSAAKEVAKVRNAVVKACKEGRDEALKIQKAWIAKEKEVLAKVADVENPLDAQIEAFDNEAKRKEQAEKQRQEEAYMMRTQAITKMGALYHDSSFTLGDFTLEASLVKESSLEVWENEILPRFSEEHLKIEGERVEKERKEAEAKAKFEQEQAEFRKQKEEYERQRQEAEREREAVRNKLQNERFKLIAPYGGIDGNTVLWNLEQSEFDKMLETKKAVYEKLMAERQRQIEEAAAKKERERILQEQWAAEEKVRKEEAKRQEELAKASDKEKWAVVEEYLRNTPIHEMRSSQYRTKMKHVKDFLNEILKQA